MAKRSKKRERNEDANQAAKRILDTITGGETSAKKPKKPAPKLRIVKSPSGDA